MAAEATLPLNRPWPELEVVIAERDSDDMPDRVAIDLRVKNVGSTPAAQVSCKRLQVDEAPADIVEKALNKNHGAGVTLFPGRETYESTLVETSSFKGENRAFVAVAFYRIPGSSNWLVTPDVYVLFNALDRWMLVRAVDIQVGPTKPFTPLPSSRKVVHLSCQGVARCDDVKAARKTGPDDDLPGWLTGALSAVGHGYTVDREGGQSGGLCRLPNSPDCHCKRGGRRPRRAPTPGRGSRRLGRSLGLGISQVQRPGSDPAPQ